MTVYLIRDPILCNLLLQLLVPHVFQPLGHTPIRHHPHPPPVLEYALHYMIRDFATHRLPGVSAASFDGEGMRVPVAVDHAQGETCDVVVSHLVGYTRQQGSATIRNVQRELTMV
jgi:hypothetical protein